MNKFQDFYFTKAALVADSLSLGPHWVYNQAKLTRSYPHGIHSLSDPLSQYHGEKTAGHLTHYGDQTLLLFDYVFKDKHFDLDGWRSAWLSGMEEFSGYLDGASKETLANKGMAPSSSNDLAGASRIAPLLDLNLSLEETVKIAREQTDMTHGDSGVADSAEFFVRSVYALREGKPMLVAFEEACQQGDYQSLNPTDDLAIAQQFDGVNHLEAAAKMGLTCHLPEAFPLTLYYALHHASNFVECISKNGIAGGDTSARAMLLAILFVARDGDVGAGLFGQLALNKVTTVAGSNQVRIKGLQGDLAGVLEMPEGEVKAFALFAHCFTCGKDFVPEKKITQALAKRGVATLRIDFSGLGASSGSFGETSFITNLEDIKVAADWLAKHHQSPSLLVGHSLGGAAVLSAASKIAGVKAVATIGAPADPSHVLKLFADSLGEIKQQGKAEVSLAGRTFTISQKFVDDLEDYNHLEQLGQLKSHKLIMHSPEDATVSLENAGIIYSSLSHPKSFISLAGASHLLTNSGDAEYAASLIDAWSSRALSL